MDAYRTIEIETAKKYGAVAKGTKKAIGDFLLENDINKPVNVKSNDLAKNNYSPNIISAKRLIKWLEADVHELYFIFVDYNKTDKGIEIVRDSGLVPVHHLSWDCLTIEAQGWGVIQMPKPLSIDRTQTKADFYRNFKNAYETYMAKEKKKMEQIEKMIKDF